MKYLIKNIIKVVMFLLITIYCAPYSFAGLVEALDAYNRGDYVTSENLYRAEAEKGNAEIQTILGLMYLDGQGIQQNNSQAMYWLRKAADQGNAEAQYNIGMIYTRGVVVGEDYKASVFWLQKAAMQGHVNAQYRLGLMYDLGRGVLLDHSSAAYWFQQASVKGHYGASCILGGMYALGVGVPRNYSEAKRLVKFGFNSDDKSTQEFCAKVWEKNLLEVR